MTAIFTGFEMTSFYTFFTVTKATVTISTPTKVKGAILATLTSNTTSWLALLGPMLVRTLKWASPTIITMPSPTDGSVTPITGPPRGLLEVQEVPLEVLEAPSAPIQATRSPQCNSGTSNIGIITVYIRSTEGV